MEKRGAHTVSLRTTGHEKAKITVCLTACANGDKKKPFFVFKGAKREVKRLNEEFRTQCVVATSASGWMTEELTEQEISGGSWCIYLWQASSSSVGFISLSLD